MWFMLERVVHESVLQHTPFEAMVFILMVFYNEHNVKMCSGKWQVFATQMVNSVLYNSCVIGNKLDAKIWTDLDPIQFVC